MKNDATNKRILYSGLAVLFVIFVIGVIWTNSRSTEVEYNFPGPEKVVEQYFSSWNNKDYTNMYATISDGFKKIEPTAITLKEFKNYVDSQGIQGVKILTIKEISNDGQTASVDYDVEFVLTNGQKTPFRGAFTLKYRKDVIQGWKLIHPYGEKIDTG